LRKVGTAVFGGEGGLAGFSRDASRTSRGTKRCGLKMLASTKAA
jgi:hypothetical protein